MLASLGMTILSVVLRSLELTFLFWIITISALFQSMYDENDF
jgi:hypothetical protein